MPATLLKKDSNLVFCCELFETYFEEQLRKTDSATDSVTLLQF